MIGPIFAIIFCLAVLGIFIYAAINEGIVPVLEKFWDALREMFYTLLHGNRAQTEAKIKEGLEERRLAVCVYHQKQLELQTELGMLIDTETVMHIDMCYQHRRTPDQTAALDQARNILFDKKIPTERDKMFEQYFGPEARCYITGGDHTWDLAGTCPCGACKFSTGGVVSASTISAYEQVAKWIEAGHDTN